MKRLVLGFNTAEAWHFPLLFFDLRREPRMMLLFVDLTSTVIGSIVIYVD